MAFCSTIHGMGSPAAYNPFRETQPPSSADPCGCGWPIGEGLVDGRLEESPEHSHTHIWLIRTEDALGYTKEVAISHRGSYLIMLASTIWHYCLNLADRQRHQRQHLDTIWKWRLCIGPSPSPRLRQTSDSTPVHEPHSSSLFVVLEHGCASAKLGVDDRNLQSPFWTGSLVQSDMPYQYVSQCHISVEHTCHVNVG